MIIWKCPKDDLPPQGKKILYVKEGDVYVVQRFGKYWLPIPFFDSKFSFYEPPDLWAEFNFPGSLTGKVRIKVEDVLYDIDDLEHHHNDVYQEIIRMQLGAWGIRSDMGMRFDG